MFNGNVTWRVILPPYEVQLSILDSAPTAISAVESSGQWCQVASRSRGWLGDSALRGWEQNILARPSLPRHPPTGPDLGRRVAVRGPIVWGRTGTDGQTGAQERGGEGEGSSPLRSGKVRSGGGGAHQAPAEPTSAARCKAGHLQDSLALPARPGRAYATSARPEHVSSINPNTWPTHAFYNT